MLRHLAAERSNAEIADELVLSVRTVERHISNIYAKIGARGRIARAVATSYAHTHALTHSRRRGSATLRVAGREMRAGADDADDRRS